jgi:hypothetical protein
VQGRYLRCLHLILTARSSACGCEPADNLLISRKTRLVQTGVPRSNVPQPNSVFGTRLVRALATEHFAQSNDLRTQRRAQASARGRRRSRQRRHSPERRSSRQSAVHTTTSGTDTRPLRRIPRQWFIAPDRIRYTRARTSTTLADLFTPLLRVDPGSAVRTSPRA